MKIAIGGSLGNIGKPLTQKLVGEGHEVTVISSRAERKHEIEALGAKAAIGLVNDAEFLTNTLKGADAVFAMTPPNLGGSNVVANTVNAGRAYASAIQSSGIKRVVMLSSIGAHLPDGNGPIKAIHQIEKIYDQLDASVTYLRAGYFYINFYHDIPMIVKAGIEGSNFSATTRMPMVDPEDIALIAASELTRQGATGKQVRYVIGDIRTGAEIAKILGASIGKPELPWIEFTDQQAIDGMAGAGVPDEIARLYAEMGAGFRNGSIVADFVQQGEPVVGKITLKDFAKKFSGKFANSTLVA